VWVAAWAGPRGAGNYTCEILRVTINTNKINNPRWGGWPRLAPFVVAERLFAVQPPREPLPITETGYKSHFVAIEAIETAGGPVAYAWRESRTPRKTRHGKPCKRSDGRASCFRPAPFLCRRDLTEWGLCDIATPCLRIPTALYISFDEPLDKSPSNWCQFVGENSPLVKLLRSSGRYVEGGKWVTE
jgi:hypothetical protein